MIVALVQMVAVVSLWWFANGIATIAAKLVMETQGTVGVRADESGIVSVKPSFKDLRWLELSTLQHLFGAVASVMLLKTLYGKSAVIWPRDSPKVTVCVAILANVVGSLATNSAYALPGLSVTEAVMSFEPMFIFFLCFCLYDNHKNLNQSTLVSILVMIAGMCTLLVTNTSVNVWSIFGALFYNISIAVRSIHLKKLSWESPFQKYAVVSIGSTLFLVPVTLLKLAFVSTHTSSRIIGGSVISSIFHFIYNTASIAVLQEVSPLTLAVLNLSRRVCEVIATHLVYHLNPYLLNLIIGLVIFVIGIALYSLSKTNSKKNFRRTSFYILLIAWMCFLGISTASQFKLSSVDMHITTKIHILRKNVTPIHSGIEPQSLNANVQSFGATVSLEWPKVETSNTIQSVNVIPSIERPRQWISTAWAYSRDIPQIVLSNIETLGIMSPYSHIHVYCGTSQCIEAVSATSRTSKSVSVEFLVVSELVKDTPLEQWLARHPLNKVLAGLEFEDHLQIVTQLAILWQYGGTYVNPMVTIKDNVGLEQACQNGWIGRGKTSSLFDISCFPKNHPLIKTTMEKFVSDYPKHLNKTLNFHFSLTDVLQNAYDSCCQSHFDESCPANSNLNYTVSSLSQHTSESSHFGTLSYNVRVKKINGANLGDEIQGFPGIQFLPFLDQFLERDKLRKLKTKEPVTAFFNAWWGDKSMSWPPPNNVHPIMLSVHVKHHIQALWAKNIDYLKANAPVGCRDLGSLAFMRKYNVDAYFSGCLTLMIKNPSLGKELTSKIYLVDLSNMTKELLPKEIQEQGIDITHNYINSDNNHGTNFERFSRSFRLIELYATARLVVTRRIHCALPCVAMGIPVIFVNTPKMPGGGGSKTHGSPRITGLTPLFHTLDMYEMSKEEAEMWLHDFDWNNPPPNPNVNMMMRMRATFWDVIRQNQALYDSAHKFGMIPLHPPPALDSEHHELLFHLVFTTSAKPLLDKDHGSIKGGFNWRHWRTLESIFHHHPFARVMIHSNMLQQSEFNVLTEAGYRIEVKQYDLEDMLRNLPLHDLSHNYSATMFQRADQLTDLLRLLTVYKWGGIYLDSDMILIKPVNLLKNTIVWQAPSASTFLDGIFMSFDKGNSYIRDCLVDFSNIDDKDHSSGLLIFIRNYYKYAKFNDSSAVVNLDHDNFFLFHWSKIAKDCFEALPETEYAEALRKFRASEAFVAFLNSKITGREGTDEKLKKRTICKHVLNDFCVLCNRRY